MYIASRMVTRRSSIVLWYVGLPTDLVSRILEEDYDRRRFDIGISYMLCLFFLLLEVSFFCSWLLLLRRNCDEYLHNIEVCTYGT